MNPIRTTGVLLAVAALALPTAASAGGFKSYGYKVVAASGTSTWHGEGSNGSGDARLTWKLAKPTAGAPNNAHLQQMSARTWIGDVAFNYFGTLTASDHVNFGKSCSSTIHSGQDPFNAAEPPLAQLALANQGKTIAATWTFLPLANLVFDDPDGTCNGISGGPSWPASSDPARTKTIPLSAFTRKRLTLTSSGTVANEGSLNWKASVTLQRVVPKKKRR
jgi:hypothetical protein